MLAPIWTNWQCKGLIYQKVFEYDTKIYIFSDGKNHNAADYAKIIEEIQEITLSVNSTFKIPIIYG